MQGKVVLITGAARRVGAALAKGLAADGWSVAIHYRHAAEEAEALAKEIATSGGVAKTFKADLSDKSDREIGRAHV